MEKLNIINYIILFLAHMLCGLGIIGWLRVKLNPFITLSLATIVGIIIHSMVPILLDMISIELIAVNVAWGIAIITFLSTSGLIWGRKVFKSSLEEYSFQIRTYEIPFLALIGFILCVAAYRCYYLPVTPRDALSGPEAIAEFAVREGKIANSFFSINLETTNNQHKSPYLIGLQIIYKLFVQSFGQMWLNTLVFSFIVFLYSSLKEKTHPIISGLLLFLFIATPECFAYTVMILYDYSNMVLFTLGAYILHLFWAEQGSRQLWLAALLFSLATYIRTETLILIGLFFPLFFIDWRHKKYPLSVLTINFGSLIGACFFAYLFVMKIYLPICIPEIHDVTNDINKDWSNIGFFFTRFIEINDHLIFSRFGVNYWNYFIYIFILVMASNFLIYKKNNRDEFFWIYMVLVIYIGIPLMGYIIPLMDLNNTSKRSLFKILPLMLYFMAHTRLLKNISNSISSWENNALIPQAKQKNKKPAINKPSQIRPIKIAKQLQ